MRLCAYGSHTFFWQSRAYLEALGCKNLLDESFFFSKKFKIVLNFQNYQVTETSNVFKLIQLISIEH